MFEIYEKAIQDNLMGRQQQTPNRGLPSKTTDEQLLANAITKKRDEEIS